MKRDMKLGHITPAGANIFAELGFEPNEASKLLSESNKIISEKLAIKESLMTGKSGQTSPTVSSISD